MHFLRGSGLAGLRGMLPVTNLGDYALLEPLERPLELIRPLLTIPRAAIEDYCEDHHLETRLDSTNLDTTYFRNRLRHELLPLLEDILRYEMIPEYQEMVAAGDKNAANYVHKESGYLASKLRDIARSERKNKILERLPKAETDSTEFDDLEEIWKSEKAAVQGAHHIKEELERARMELDTAQRAGDLARAGELQYGRIPELEKQLAMAQESETRDTVLLRNKVTEEEIAEVVSRWTGIPVSKMLEGEREKLVRIRSSSSCISICNYCNKSIIM